MKLATSSKDKSGKTNPETPMKDISSRNILITLFRMGLYYVNNTMGIFILGISCFQITRAFSRVLL